MVTGSGTDAATPPRRRLRIRIEGIVQGVGFRPHIYRLAHRLGLAGQVLNDSRGVVVEVEGGPTALAEFLDRLETEAPSLAAIERVTGEEVAPRGGTGFIIVESDDAGPATTLVAPDLATCDACLRELFDPTDRRYRYPFINCTHCGPRFTIIRGLPYDRPLTTMAGFPICASCRAEYEDPADRRFHAQPIACPACGPRVWVVDASGAVAGGDCRPDRAPAADPILAVAAALREGAIVAVKGLGGFHLACLARDPAAVRALRERKRRPTKPFALMAPDLPGVRRLVRLDAAEEALLLSRERPIVLAQCRKRPEIAPEVAPGLRELGVMLPYTPLHHLLLAEVGEAVVLTSGNVSDEPIAFRNDDAVGCLSGIADLFLLHDRPIHLGVDDSVARVVTVDGERRVQLIRRSRGYAPRPLALPTPSPRPLLACGGQLKNTFCLARGGRAWPSQHIGDLGEVETLRSFGDGVVHLEGLCGLRPEVLAHDLHPEYLATKYAMERGERLLGIQHHHAHLAACLAEHGERGPALGVIFDGTGYGPDGTVWGGEFLLGDLVGCERVAHLYQVRLPGGEAAIREPWRMACSWLIASGVEALPATLAGAVDPARWAAVARLARGGTASPLTSSVGRLFDAVAALCGLGAVVSYEGEAAIALEAAVDPEGSGWYELPVIDSDALTLDARPLIRAVVAELEAGAPVGTIAARFHNALARVTAQVYTRLAERNGVRQVCLSGGVFQNRELLERTAAELVRSGARVLIPERIPPNDGGISYGQAAIAAAQLAAEG